MKDKDTKGQEQLIKNLKERLRWYAYECKPEEFNEKEVRTIVELLKELDPVEPQEYFNAEKGLERFWSYYEQRREEDEAYESHRKDLEKENRFGRDHAAQDVEAAEAFDADLAACGSLTETNKTGKSMRYARADKSKKLFSVFGRHKAMTGTVTAAVLVVVVLLGGTFGSYAEKDTGFFHWISKEKGDVRFITSPQESNIGAGVNEVQKYNSLDEAPDIIKDQIWEPSVMPEVLTLESIEVLSFSDSRKITSRYGDDDSTIYLAIGIKSFENKIIYHSQKYNDFNYVYDIDLDEINVEFFSKESDDEIEYAACFYSDNILYSIQGNLTEDEIKELAINYVEHILLEVK